MTGMARPPRENRASVADVTLTVRLTSDDRDMLHCLVEHHAKQAAEHGFVIDATIAGFLRGLIRREARALGIEAHHDAHGKIECMKKTGT